MSAKNKAVHQYLIRMNSEGVDDADAMALRRAAMTLQRWHELECGDSNDYASWAIERDPETDKPFIVTHPHRSGAKSTRRAIPDREKGAHRRIAAICQRIGAKATIQGDPRGWPLKITFHQTGAEVWPPIPNS